MKFTANLDSSDVKDMFLSLSPGVRNGIAVCVTAVFVAPRLVKTWKMATA